MKNIIKKLNDIVKNKQFEFTVVHVDSLTERIIETNSFQENDEHLTGFIEYTKNKNPIYSIFVNGTCVVQSKLSDKRKDEIEGCDFMMRIKSTWVQVETYMNARIYTLDGEHIMYILKSSMGDTTHYIIEHESSTEPLGYRTERLSKEELKKIYDIEF